MPFRRRLTAVVLTGLGFAGLAVAGCSRPGPVTHARTAAVIQPVAGLSALYAGLSHRQAEPAYYLSLGDSLSQGIQPGPTGSDGPTAQGYSDQLDRILRTTIPAIKLVKLGCSGETSATMIHGGGKCHYPAGSQLAQADGFLRSHWGQVALITIDIGANDPNSCVLGQPVSHIFGCLSSRITQTERNVDSILASLRAAAGKRVLIVGMTYYVPELGLWRRGPVDKDIALLTEGIAAGVNQLLAIRYHRFGARVADVFHAFRSADFSGAVLRSSQPVKSGVPLNVAAVCSLTWMCARGPRGPNEHANASGYHVIAEAFWRAINS